MLPHSSAISYLNTSGTSDVGARDSVGDDGMRKNPPDGRVVHVLEEVDALHHGRLARVPTYNIHCGSGGKLVTAYITNLL